MQRSIRGDPGIPRGIYHYYVTPTYPFVQRCVRGTSSTATGMNGGGSMPGEPGGMTGPPQEALDACVGLSNGDECRFTSPRGDMVMGTCGLTADDRLARMPAGGPPR